MKIDYYPLGSVVLLKGGIRKILIVARGINVSNNGQQFFFDYGGVMYPEGMIGDRLAYFNHESIAEVVFKGFEDVDNTNMVANINAYLEEHPETVKGTPEHWKQS